MAYVKYSETYREHDIFMGIEREFKKELEISGKVDEVEQLLPKAFIVLPRYNYKITQAREDFQDLMLKRLKSGKD